MLALPRLTCLELANAAKSYDTGKEAIRHPAPFVPYWEQTFGYAHENVLGYSFTDVVMELLHKDPNQFRKTQNETDFLTEAVTQDRNATDRERRSIERFVGGIKTRLQHCGIRVSD